jgi:hypothetical protein
MKDNSPMNDDSPLLAEWLSQRCNSVHYLKRGQVQALLLATGLGQNQIDTLWPEGHPAKKRLRGMKMCVYVRSRVLRDLGVNVISR